MKNIAKEKEMTKINPQCTVKIDPYPVIAEAVDDGIEAGFQRAYKYQDSPSVGDIQQAISDAIMLNLSEIMIFSED